MTKWNACNLASVLLFQSHQKKFLIFITNQEKNMKIQTSFTVLPKYFNDFHNYFNNVDEKLVSYTYIPEYLRKNTEKNSEALIKTYWEKECLSHPTNQHCLVYCD